MSDNAESLVRKLYELWATRDAQAMANLFSEDCSYLNVPTNAPMVGRQAVLDWLGKVFHHLERIDVEVLHMISKDGWVLSERRDDHIFHDRTMPLPVMNAAPSLSRNTIGAAISSSVASGRAWQHREGSWNEFAPLGPADAWRRRCVQL